jgi:hypothetical protein
MAFRGDSGLVLFDFGEMHRLAFAVRDSDIMLLNLKLSKRDGSPLLDVVDGYVRLRDPSIELKTRPGKVYIRGGINSEYVPEWARVQLIREDELSRLIKLPLLDIEVVEPGLVRVQGIWMKEDGGVIIRRDKLSFLQPGFNVPLSLVGEGEATQMVFVGPVGMSLFEMG